MKQQEIAINNIENILKEFVEKIMQSSAKTDLKIINDLGTNELEEILEIRKTLKLTKDTTDVSIFRYIELTAANIQETANNHQNNQKL